jgi:hypothetical protein
MVTKIDKAVLKMLRSRIDAMLKDLGEELGLKFECAGGRFMPLNATIKVNLAVVGDDGSVMDKDRVAWDTYHMIFKLKKDDLGKEFMASGTTYEITGLNPNRYKYPVSAKRKRDGASFKFGANTVLKGLGRPQDCLSVD